MAFRARRDATCIKPQDEISFKLDQCLSCGQVMQNPLPTSAQLSKAYSAEYAPYRPAWKESGWPLWKILREWTTWRRMRPLAPLWEQDTGLLEVGCGAGDFLSCHAPRRLGCVRAVEYSGTLAEALRAELSFDVRTGDLRPGLWEDGSF